MRLFACHEERMIRALHSRWPYRRAHCRHDLHWLVRVQPNRCRCATGRMHVKASLPTHHRRPHSG